MRVAMRQIAGVFSQLEKTRLVKKLKAARDRKRVHGKVEGRRSHVELHPEVVEEAKRLARASPKTASAAHCALSRSNSQRSGISM
jgi:DNA invertase Pin-like site-specific DNA recombinase